MKETWQEKARSVDVAVVGYLCHVPGVDLTRLDLSFSEFILRGCRRRWCNCMGPGEEARAGDATGRLGRAARVRGPIFWDLEVGTLPVYQIKDRFLRVREMIARGRGVLSM